MSDDVTRALECLSGKLPKPRLGLTEFEKDQLVASIGPRTALAIVKAKKDFPPRRIPFLFSAVNTQAVADILANEMGDAIKRALAAS